MKTGITRRAFLNVAAAAGVASNIEVKESTSANAGATKSRYESEVPDTLDLAERAAFSVNALTGAADPEHNYETYQSTHLDHRPPYMNHTWGGPCLQKPIQALPMMRIMSGSTLRAEYDARMVAG